MAKRTFTVKIKGGGTYPGTLDEATGYIQTPGAAFSAEPGPDSGYTVEETTEAAEKPAKPAAPAKPATETPGK